MKNKTQVGIGIGLMCVLLTTGIVVQLNTINEATKIAGTSFAQEELREEVLESKAEYERLDNDTKNRLIEKKDPEKARQESTKESSRAAELQAELDSKNKLLGLTEISRLWNNINT